jgi:hypothetical protein
MVIAGAACGGFRTLNNTKAHPFFQQNKASPMSPAQIFLHPHKIVVK